MENNMESKIGFFEQFYIALMKHTRYRTLAALPKKQVMGYLMGITFLLTLVSYVIPMSGFLAALGGYEHFFAERLPAFSIEKGELHVETEAPMDFMLNGIHIVVDDSVAVYTQDDLMQEKEPVVYFSRHNIVTNVSAIPLEIRYGIFGENKIDNKYMVSVSPAFYGMLVLSGLVSWLIQMAAYAFLAVIFAACGLSVNRMSGASLSFQKIFCIAVYAQTAFALASHLAVYFFTGILSLAVYMISAMISVRAMNIGIVLHAVIPPKL